MHAGAKPTTESSAVFASGRYRLLARLGAGGMADVFLAAASGPMAFSKLVVVKALRPADAADDRVRMFIDEARLAARLNHPQIVQTFEVAAEGDLHFMVMEYVEGQPLSELAKLGRLDPMLASYVVKQVLDALHYAHELRDYDGRRLNVVHGDVSPQNVIVTYAGDVKLVDFGIAKTAASKVQTGVGVIDGNAAYLAPEQARGEGADARSDVFAAGAVFWELLSGRLLTTGADEESRLSARVFRAKPRLREVATDVDGRLDAIVGRALESDPKDRFATAKEMSDEIGAVLGDVPERELRDRLGDLMTRGFGDRRAALKEQVAAQMASIPESRSQLVTLRADETIGASGVNVRAPREDNSVETMALSANRIGAADHLPVLLTEIIGRAREVEAIERALETTRLLTLSGPGGTGKTALALQAGHALSSRFPDGAYFVPLSSISDPKLVPATIADACGVRDVSGQPMLKTLQAFFSDRSMLLVVDNFEQVVDAGPVLSEILERSARLKILVTSRVCLRVQGEREIHVPPLPTPDLRKLPPLAELEQNPSVRLFRQRAREVSAGFELTEDNAAAVARICSELDGLPLAIELAAARSKIMSPQALAGRLGDRLKLLTGGARNLPEHQRTLRGTIAWSYDLLTDDERAFFERLAIFPGGCSLDAVEAIAPEGADALEGLTSLVDKSLLMSVSAHGEEPRFAMLATIREFGLERLAASGRAADVARAHAEFFRRFAFDAGAGLLGRERHVWLSRVAIEQDNLRAAIRWSLSAGEPEIGQAIVGELWSWYQLAFNEGRELCDALIRASEGRPPTTALSSALHTAACAAWAQADIRGMRAFAEKDVAISMELRAPRREALAKISLALSYLGDASSREFVDGLFADAKRIMEELDDPLNGLVGGYAGAYSMLTGRPDEARVWFQYAENLFERRGGLWQVNVIRMHTAMLELHAGSAAAAEKLLSGCIPAFEMYRDTIFLSLSLVGLAVAIRREGGDLSRAAASYTRALANCRETGDLGNAPICLEGLAATALAAGKPERAAWLIGAARTARAAREFGMPLDGVYDQMLPATLEAVSRVLPEDRRDALLREGGDAPLERVFAYALEA